jgi:hypothetical protein
MTTPVERTRAVVETRRFLEHLAAGRLNRATRGSLQDVARSLLRHYPSASDMRLASMAPLIWWPPPEEPLGER